MLKRILCTLIVVVLSSNLFAGAALAATETTARTVSIFNIEGSNVKMTKGTEKEFNAKVGLNLYDGYTISTGDGDYCYLKLDDNSLLKMDQKSKIRVNKASSNKLSISVLSGGLLVDAETQKQGNTVEVSVGNSALAIRGTYFITENVLNKSAVYTMFEGSGNVDGYDLPSGYIMNVYDRIKKGNTDSNKQSDQHDREHELVKFEINEVTSVFVLRTILGDVDRFIENGTIKKEDVSKIEGILESKLGEGKSESKSRYETSEYVTKLSSYHPGGSDSSDSGDPGVGSTAVEKAYLYEALVTANYAKATTFVNTASTNVYVGWQWVTQAEMDAFNRTITDAQNLYNASTNQRQIDDTTSYLFSETLRFESVKRQGIKPPSPEILTLQASMQESSESKQNVYVSEDGSDVYDDSYWVTQTEMNELNVAVAGAYDAAGSAMSAPAARTVALAVSTYAASSQSRAVSMPVISDATNNLNAAVTQFNKVKQPGTKPVDKNKLLAAIEHARFVANDVSVDTNGLQTEPGAYWITKENKDYFLSKIAAVEAEYKNSASSRDIMLAVYEINKWVYWLTDQMQWGMKEPAVPLTDAEKNELRSAITTAKGIMKDVVASEGYDIGSEQRWVLPWLYDYLTDAIAKAESALNTVKSLWQVYDEVYKLDSIAKIFNECTMTGSLDILPLPIEKMRPLIDAIDAAKKAMEGVVTSDKGEDLDAGTKWVTQSVMSTLRTEWTYATAALKSGQNVTDRANRLNSRVNEFNNYVATVTLKTTQLDAQIVYAYEVMSGVKVSTNGDGSDLGGNDNWVTQLEWNALASVLTAAETTLDTAKRQNDVDDMEMELAYAILDFQKSIRGGKVWVLTETGESFSWLVDAVEAASPGNTIELTGNGFLPFSLGVIGNPAGYAVLNNVNLIINESAELKIEGGQLRTLGNFEVINNGTITNVGNIALNGGTFVNNGLLNSASSVQISASTTFINNGEINNHSGATNAMIEGSFENNGTFNNYSSHTRSYDTNVIYGGLEISGDFANKGVFTNHPDATTVVSGGCVNTGEMHNHGKTALYYLASSNGPVEYKYYGITISGSFINEGIVTNSSENAYEPDPYNDPNKLGASVLIKDGGINTGTIENHNLLNIAGSYAIKENGKLHNSGGLNVVSGQCEATDTGALVNDGFLTVEGGTLVFSVGSTFANSATLTINEEFVYNSTEAFTNTGDVLVGGELEITGAGDLVNDENISVHPGGTFIFSSGGSFINNGTFDIFPALSFLGLPKGRFEYMSDHNMINAGEIAVHGNAAFNPSVVLIGAGSKAEVSVSNPVTIPGDFRDKAGNQIMGALPVGEYLWNDAAQYWAGSCDQDGIVFDKSVLEMTIEDAEAAKTGVVVSNDGTDVAYGGRWVDSFSMMLLEIALESAKDKLANAAAQQEIDDSVTELSYILKSFKEAIQVKGLDKSSLLAAIENAKAVMMGVVVSADGSDVGDDERWVIPSVMEDLEKILTNAEYCLNNAEIQFEIDMVEYTLYYYAGLFMSAIQVGPPKKVWLNDDTDVRYKNIFDAVSAANDGETIKLTDDTTISGYALFDTRDINLVIEENATLTVSADSIFAPPTKITNNGTLINERWVCVLESSTFINNGTIINNSEFFIEGLFESNDVSEFINAGTLSVYAKGSVTITSPAKIIGRDGSKITLYSDSNDDWGDTIFYDSSPGDPIPAGSYIWYESFQFWLYWPFFSNPIKDTIAAEEYPFSDNEPDGMSDDELDDQRDDVLDDEPEDQSDGELDDESADQVDDNSDDEPVDRPNGNSDDESVDQPDDNSEDGSDNQLIDKPSGKPDDESNEQSEDLQDDNIV